MKRPIRRTDDDDDEDKIEQKALPATEEVVETPDKPRITWNGHPDNPDYKLKRWNGVDFPKGEPVSIAHLPSNMQLAMINACKSNPEIYTVVLKS